MAQGAGQFEPALRDGLISAEAVAEAVIQGLAENRFMILPHPEVSQYFSNKAADYGRWIGGMAKMRRLTRAGTR